MLLFALLSLLLSLLLCCCCCAVSNNEFQPISILVFFLCMFFLRFFSRLIVLVFVSFFIHFASRRTHHVDRYACGGVSLAVYSECRLHVGSVPHFFFFSSNNYCIVFIFTLLYYVTHLLFVSLESGQSVGPASQHNR